MQSYTAVIEKCRETGLYVAYVTGWPGAHTQGASLDELLENLKEVLALLSEEGAPTLAADFVGVQTVAI